MSTSYSNTRPEFAVSEAMTLPQRYYTDPAWFQREMEAIHFDMWLCAGRTSQIPDSGDYFLRQFANASVIITRDEQGKVRAFHNVCRHRGTMLCHRKKANSRVAFNASITHGLINSMAHWPARRTWKKSRASAKLTIR
jgi:Rieske 2Fe-2S family protein